MDTVNGHNWDTEWSDDGTNHYRRCLNPGCEVNNEDAPHSGGKATCVAKAVCEVCGKEYGVIDADAHPEDKLADAAAVEATCTETGLTAGKHCTACGAVPVKQEIVPAKGHTPGAAVNENMKAATCTQAGSYDEAVYCTVCSAELSRVAVAVPATDHTWVTTSGSLPTCTQPGTAESMYCSVCGETVNGGAGLPALGHDYAVTARTITRVYYACRRCKDAYWTDNAYSRNLLPGLVRGANGENADYAASAARPTLTLTPERTEKEWNEEIALCLAPEYVKQWLNEGIRTVAMRCGDALLTVDLAAVSPEWFPADTVIDAYVFTLSPSENGAALRVEAQSGGAGIPAEAFDGATLTETER